MPSSSRLAICGVLLLLCNAPARTQTAPSGVLHDPTDQDRNAITALLVEQDHAWAKGDADGYTARALPEVLFTNVVGAFSVGKPPLLAQVRAIFSTIYKGSHVKTTLIHVSLIGDDVAAVDCMTELRDFVRPPAGAELVDGAVHTRLQEIMVRKDGKWWVASLHNVLINPAFMPKTELAK